MYPRRGVERRFFNIMSRGVFLPLAAMHTKRYNSCSTATTCTQVVTLKNVVKTGLIKGTILSQPLIIYAQLDKVGIL